MTDWDELVRHEGSAVWRTVYRLVRNRSDAEECFQEAFLAAVEFSRRERVENWAALLRRLATARAIDRLRLRVGRQRREELSDPATFASGDPGPPEKAQAAELSTALRRAIAQLPPRQAEVFCLCEIEDWSYQQVAEHLQITPSAVGVLLHRARMQLREILAGTVQRQS